MGEDTKITRPKANGLSTKKVLKQKIDSAVAEYVNYCEQNELEKLDGLFTVCSQTNDLEATRELLNAVKQYKYVENGYCLKNSVHISDQNYVANVRKALIEEYQITSLADKMIIDLAVSSYFSGMRASSLYNSLLSEDDGTVKLTQIRNGLLKELNKRIETATRQFNSIINYLSERNSPAINIKVKTSNAYIATNQQFNKNI